MGGQNGVLSCPGNLRTAVIAKDSGPYKVRQIGVGSMGNSRGLLGKNICTFFFF